MGQAQEMLSFNQTRLYQEDWIGLKSLNEQGKVDFLISEGDHLHFTDKFLFHIIETYLADWINSLFVHCLHIWTLACFFKWCVRLPEKWGFVYLKSIRKMDWTQIEKRFIFIFLQKIFFTFSVSWHTLHLKNNQIWKNVFGGKKKKTMFTPLLHIASRTRISGTWPITM